MRLPSVSIIGRPNVGKSTLFNRLLRSKKAIVHPQAGVTRDFIEERVEHLGRSFQLIDTGGLIETIDDALTPAVWEATFAVLETSTLVLFVVDGRTGRTPADEMIAEKLRKLSKPVFLVVNKIDTPKNESLAGEFYSLGYEKMFAVSAEHGRGLFDLLDEVAKALPKTAEAEEEENSALKVAIVGKPNVGKSSLLNQLLGRERAIVSEIPGTTRDSIDTECVYKEKRYIFIDTAGIKRKAKIKKHLDKISVLKARRAIERADVALIVLDPTEKLSHQDIAVARLATQRGASPILVINKWDLLADLSPDEKGGIAEYLKLKMNFLPYAQIAKTSAARGWGISKLFELIDSADSARRKQVPTSALNRALAEIVAKNPPPVRGKGSFKILYATQTAVNPPSFLLFVTKPDALTQKYLLYLDRALREKFELMGTPIVIKVRGRRE